MTGLDEYFELLDRLVAYALDQDVLVCSLLDKPPDCMRVDVQKAVELRSFLATQQEVDEFAEYFSLCSFERFKERDRAAAILISFELSDKLEVARLRRDCQAYEVEQPLFRCAPDLWQERYPQKDKKPPELLLSKKLQWDPSGQLVSLGLSKARVNSHLRPQFLNWLRENFSADQLYIRIDPFDIGPELRPNLEEVALRPAAHNWWHTLEVWPGTRNAATYELESCSPGVDIKRFWEREVKQLGRLEVTFNRNNSGCLSAMLEELPRTSQRTYLVGYCLHLTSEFCPVGTPWDAALVGHIDGAINVYCDGEASNRQLTTLANGMVSDASFRTHLFRLNNVHLKHIIPISREFFRSECLVSDWLQDQFGVQI